MSNVPSSRPTESARAPRFQPFLLLLFAASGCAALIYEIVWFQMLGLVIGSSAISLAVLLGTFMGGMCLGSLALPRLISERRHPLVVYAVIELAIGIIGLGVLWGMPYVDRSIRGGAAAPLASCARPRDLPSAANCAMGATYGHRSLDQVDPEGVSVGAFYGNIAGAFGCLFQAFTSCESTTRHGDLLRRHQCARRS